MADAGFALATARCARCYRAFSFDPVRVPSLDVDGSRQPLCRPCVVWLNMLRELRGDTPVTIYPDSYGPARASENPS